MTPLQLITFAAYILLATGCLWACRVQPRLRPWALAMLSLIHISEPTRPY